MIHGYETNDGSIEMQMNSISLSKISMKIPLKNYVATTQNSRVDVVSNHNLESITDKETGKVLNNCYRQIFNTYWIATERYTFNHNYAAI